MTPPSTSSPACLLDDESFRKPYSLPKILDGKFYKNIQPNQKTPGAIQATCTTCFGLISGTTKSTGNFLSHIKRRHKELLPLCQLYCQAKNVVVNSSTSASAPSSGQVVNKLPQLNATVTSTTPATLELTPTVTTQLPTSYATTTTHLAVPVTAVPMSLPIPIAIPNVQAPQMVALMTQPHQGHGAVFISKDF
ncbi:uncharacterized protein pre-mod(mdg4)-E [Drosophila tropicalis]|uniref:uncharacterized protein pre-mod(mdg4)-E n=1 Tax=Drosophila tropicalis TaxID=46794 RepID=UPI0035AB876B